MNIKSAKNLVHSVIAYGRYYVRAHIDPRNLNQQYIYAKEEHTATAKSYPGEISRYTVAIFSITASVG